MSLKQIILFFVGSLLVQHYAAAQLKRHELLFGNTEYRQTDTGLVIIQYVRNGCKNFNMQLTAEEELLPTEGSKITSIVKNSRVKFLTVHGNVSYDFFYRSRIDTPFNQRDLQQHTERVSLEIMVNEKYPVRLAFAARQSNSPFFSNFLDLNFQFDRNKYRQKLKEKILREATASLPDMKEAQRLDSIMKKYQLEKLAVKKRTNDPALLQKIIEQREKVYREKLKAGTAGIPGKPGYEKEELKIDNPKKEKWADKKNEIDSILKNITLLDGTEKKEIDSLDTIINNLGKKRDSLKYTAGVQYKKIMQKINRANTYKDIVKVGSENNVPSQEQGDHLTKLLSSVNQFSIGRSMINYTELTAQNIMLSGINVEINPSYYAAFAAGKINYRFRDFLNKHNSNNNQYLLLGRFGYGDKERKAIIFTLFQGRKSQSEYALSDTVSDDINIVGYSIETIIRKNAHTFFSAEFAKSTKPIAGRMVNGKQTKDLWRFSDQSNMGINIKGETRIIETNSNLSGYFRRTGNNFQSFSLFSYNSNQTAWQAKLDQHFWKNKITFTGSLRQNDFSNVFTERTYKAATVFKSALLHIRVPKYPSISLGYYPGTQFYMINKERIRENAYYIVNGSLIYNYKYKGMGMTSSFLYNRYINQATDSGFMLYKGINYYANQSIFFKKMQVQAGYSYNKQPELQYQTIEASLDISFKNWLKAGAGAKMNSVDGGGHYWGQRLQLSIQMNWLGGIQVQYEKSYLPTISSTLFPVETGRIMWYKNF